MSGAGETKTVSPGLDPRRNAFRPDLAAKSLYGKVSAPNYAPGFPAQVARSAVPLRRRPVPSNGFETEALFGELVTIYDERDGWGWVQLQRDKYVGYVPLDALSREILAPTHRVRALGTFIYALPDIKSPPLMHLSLNAELSVSDRDERFCALEGGGYVVSRHVIEVGRHAQDFVEIAERLIGTPYLWGGRTRLGVDCSDSSRLRWRRREFRPRATPICSKPSWGARCRSSMRQKVCAAADLVFWKGHVGVMADSVTLVHANAHHMAVTAETLPEAVERIAKLGADIAAVKRLPGLSA